MSILKTIQYKLDKLVWAIRYRTIQRYNVIKIHSLPPNYYDTDTVMLHGMFDLLSNFIEHEKAHRTRCCRSISNKSSKWERFLYSHVPSCLFPRSRELGLEYVQWEIDETKEDCPSQSESALEQKCLYVWWKDIRPERKDPIEESGLHLFWNLRRDRIHKWKKCENSDCFEMTDDLTEEERLEQDRLLDLTNKIEEDQHREDEEMLIRLIKIRRHLWT